MKKQKNKQAKKASKLAKAENLKQKTITVKNAEGEPDTEAVVLVQNKIDYTPKVSVIIPVYNVEQYLRECLNSVVKQTLKEIEIICVDDGSTDNSLSILKEYAEKDPRIIVISRENKGVGYSRNQGIQMSKGEFIAFMDPDDYYPDLSVLNLMYSTAKKHNVKICGGSLIVYDEKRKLEIKQNEKSGCFSENKIWLYQDFQYDYGYQRYIYDTQMIKNDKIYFPEYKRFQDPPFMIKAFCTAQKFYAITAYTYAYRWAHKEIQWTEEKVFHLLCGLRDDLMLAVHNNLWSLYATTLSRIKKDYKKIILSQESQRITDVKNKIMEICLYTAKLNIAKIKYTPKVSVVLPIYNAEPYLRECLDSVVNQTLKEIEIICVNDGSTDNSLDIIKEYANKDNRIVIIDKPNAGYGQTMNCGIAIARGEYIGIVEPDDFVKLDMYETLYNKAKEFHLDMVKGNLSTFSTVNKQSLKDMSYLNMQSMYNVVASPLELQKYMVCSFNTCSAIYKRTLLLKNKILYNETPGAAFQDTSFWFKTHCSAERILFVNESLYFYRQDNPNQSIHNTKIGDYLIYEYNSIAEWIKKHHKETFTSNYFYRKFNGFVWYASKLDEVNALNFYKQIRSEFEKDAKSDLYNVELFNNYENKLIKQIMNEEYSQLPMKKIKVSVIIPVYNTEKYLSRCLDSIINQTLKEIEIICVDDGSTDNSLSVLNKYAQKDKRIKVLTQTNQRQGAARNNAMKIAQGEYIQFVDADDWLEPESLDLLYKKSKKLNLDMLCFEGQNYENGQFYQSKGLMINYASDEEKVYLSQDMPAIIPLIPISACLVFYKHSFLTSNQIRFPEHVLFEDNYFMHLALNKSNRFGIFKKILYNRRKHSSQTTANCDEHYGDYIKIVNMMVDLYKTKQDKHNNLASNVINGYCASLVYRYNTLQNGAQYRAALIKLFASIPQSIILSEYVINCISKIKSKIDYKNILKQWYIRITGKYLNLDNPQTYNEKMQWLKIYNALPIKTRLADKYLVRDWVKEKIGEQYLIPLLGVYDKFEDIDFTKIPNQFVIKCNHGSGWNIIVTDKSKLDLNEAKTKLDKWLNSNFAFLYGYELHYRDIKPKLVIEKYIDPQVSNHEIQVWCFNGKIQFVSVESIKDTDNSERGIFYPDGTRTKFEISPQHYKKLESIPSIKAFNKALELAEKMLIDVPYVRIDFIDYKDDVRFREMTFTSGSGLSVIKPDKYNMELGNLIKLPKLAYDIDTGEYYKLPKKSRVLAWLALPFNFLRVKCLQRQFNKLQVKQIYKQLSSFRLDTKNFGTADNALAVIAPKTKVSIPAWFANAQGKGSMIEGAELKQSISLKAIKSGKLQLTFKGPDRRANNVRYPLYIDYKSIKIDGKEILSSPVATWHDKPFKYEMPVKDGQVVKIAFEQRPHQYAKSELKDVILKLNPNNNYIKTNIDKIVTKVAKTYAKPLTLKPEVKPAEVKASPEEVERQKVLNLLQQSLAASQTLSKEISNLIGQIESLQKEVKTLKTEQVTTQKMLVNEQTLLQKRRKLN